jgi:hypothetical protein
MAAVYGYRNVNQASAWLHVIPPQAVVLAARPGQRRQEMSVQDSPELEREARAWMNDPVAISGTR